MAISTPYRWLLAAVAAAGLGVGGVVVAQIDDAPRAPQAVETGGTFEVGGIDVDVVGKSASAARIEGWRIAQRKGWTMLSRRFGGSTSSPSDSTLDSLVSGIVVENERIGGNRYIARLGVEFSRARAGALLGISGGGSRSSPMLVVPVLWSGGVGQVFEQRTPWQEAWSRFRSGNSTIDYVRPSGTGPDSLLINTGQVLRPGRGWWRAILAQYGASNIVIPVVHLSPRWPGGPVIGTFQARYGPDNRLLRTFTLRVANSDGIPALLDAGVKRIDDIYQQALTAGLFRSDPGLSYRPPDPNAETPADDAIADDLSGVVDHGASIIVQFDSPNAASVTATETALRTVPGVRAAVTNSLALGAISVMRVSYDGDVNQLAAALEARGWQVTRGAGAIRIQRSTGGGPAPDDKTGG